ncbi:hypothetical protein [Nocardioides caldifontis]|uniref:hypothetical protein n=1 Tax=Nocardioides caldifontis TaxID=2588938 RepID=UPI0011DFB67B|nr:hypothetical protein [Nocardioides caldifontis]
MSDEPVELVRRWERSGGHWRVLSDDGARLTLSLVTCDGGEEMSRVTSDDEELRSYVGGRSASDD